MRNVSLELHSSYAAKLMFAWYAMRIVHIFLGVPEYSMLIIHDYEGIIA